MVSKGAAKKRYRRQILYSVAGIAIGITVMILPFVVHHMMGPASPFIQGLTDPQILSSETIVSPLDAAVEFVWLVLPAIVVILLIFWISGQRIRWKGYDEAVKYTRR
ncbi:hypothetical protein E2P61_07755 [Candidatus Bathyarchaeota archaeon]|nr:hypothetical protein E2P61_07755 [Candidatus Bathyarchaeota archaeon]